jgi:hypothetical protein
MKRNDYYNLRPFFRNNRKTGLILAIIYIFVYPFTTVILSIALAIVNNIRELIEEIPEVYKTLFSYIKYCINKKIED